MRKTFPLIRDADPDDPFGTEYCFYKNVIDVVFAGSIGEEGVFEAWKLAEKHGLRILVGGELLPRIMPKGKRDFHISALHGSASDKPGVAANVCFVVVDPEVVPVPDEVRKWVLERLEVQPWDKDPLILIGDRLSKLNNEFRARNHPRHLRC